MEIKSLLAAQRQYFLSGATRSWEARIRALDGLEAALRRWETALCDALRQDLNKQPSESYMTEIGLVLEEIRYQKKHLRGWMREKRVPTALSAAPAKSFISPEPYGVVLILAPWNYPVQLCLSPLVGALAAGNCAIVKPSAYAPATSKALAQLIASAFPPELVAVVQGGREENAALLAERFDYIFFTGSVAVGKVVMEAAARHLTPVTLELGGKSPVIVDKTANLPLAARRIAFGKVLNAGQTCVEPDYLLIEASVKDAFLAEYRRALASFFPEGDFSSMPVIVSEKHFQRVSSLLERQTAVIGGGTDAQRRFVEPTVLVDVSPDSPIMQQEIFGPILPLLTFSELDECIRFIQARPRPLALYLFSEDRAAQRQVLDRLSFGGGCLNDTILHLATSHMPFGGVGSSGMGQYHGRASFETFTHHRSILKSSTRVDLPFRYPPYGKKKDRLIRLFLGGKKS